MMRTPQQRLDRIEDAMKVPAAEPDHWHWPAHWTKQDKLASMLLMLDRAPNRDHSHTDEDLEAIALELVESGKYDPHPEPEDAAGGQFEE